MKKKAEKLYKFVLACSLAVAVIVLPVMSALAAQKTAPFMGTTRAGLHENLSFYGTAVYRVNATATAQQLVTGNGFLDMICTLGGTLGKYSLALDSGTGASGLTVDSWSLAISPQVFVRLGTTVVSGEAGPGCWSPRNPVRFENGLVGIADHSGHLTMFHVHSSTGSNPGH